jgi:hypothetical protein
LNLAFCLSSLFKLLLGVLISANKTTCHRRQDVKQKRTCLESAPLDSRNKTALRRGRGSSRRPKEFV